MNKIYKLSFSSILLWWMIFYWEWGCGLQLNPCLAVRFIVTTFPELQKLLWSHFFFQTTVYWICGNWWILWYKYLYQEELQSLYMNHRLHSLSFFFKSFIYSGEDRWVFLLRMTHEVLHAEYIFTVQHLYVHTYSICQGKNNFILIITNWKHVL